MADAIQQECRVISVQAEHSVEGPHLLKMGGCLRQIALMPLIQPKQVVWLQGTTGRISGPHWTTVMQL